jgi:hypothetical protein
VSKSQSACRNHSCACWNHSRECRYHIRACQNALLWKLHSACMNHTRACYIHTLTFQKYSPVSGNFTLHVGSRSVFLNHTRACWNHIRACRNHTECRNYTTYLINQVPKLQFLILKIVLHELNWPHFFVGWLPNINSKK